MKKYLIHEIRLLSRDLDQNRYMSILDAFCLKSFSVSQLVKMPESRLRNLLAYIKRNEYYDV